MVVICQLPLIILRQNPHKSNMLFPEQVHYQCDYYAYKYGGGQREIKGEAVFLYVYVSWELSDKRYPGAKGDKYPNQNQDNTYDDQ